MKLSRPDIPKKYRPLGIDILHEDLDLIVGNKAAGFLTVSAMWEKENTIHNILNKYVQKGNPRSKKCVFVVHRLDQATSGVLLFAKSEKAQQFLKSNWPNTTKNYYALVHGHLPTKQGLIETYLEEDEDYIVHSSLDKSKGKLARTEYEVIKENASMSLLKINLLTGKKNQIRVHLAELGHPIVGDQKYGSQGAQHNSRAEGAQRSRAEGPQRSSTAGEPNRKSSSGRAASQGQLMLHSYSIEINHPHNHERVQFIAPLPEYFKKLIPFEP